MLTRSRWRTQAAALLVACICSALLGFIIASYKRFCGDGSSQVRVCESGGGFFNRLSSVSWFRICGSTASMKIQALEFSLYAVKDGATSRIAHTVLKRDDKNSLDSYVYYLRLETPFDDPIPEKVSFALLAHLRYDYGMSPEEEDFFINLNEYESRSSEPGKVEILKPSQEVILLNHYWEQKNAKDDGPEPVTAPHPNEDIDLRELASRGRSGDFVLAALKAYNHKRLQEVIEHSRQTGDIVITLTVKPLTTKDMRIPGAHSLD